MFITSAKVPEHEGSISPSSFYGQLPDYWSHVFSLIYPVDEFSFKEMKTWGQFKSLQVHGTCSLRLVYKEVVVASSNYK